VLLAFLVLVLAAPDSAIAQRPNPAKPPTPGQPPAAAQPDERVTRARRLQREAAEDHRRGRIREGIAKAREALALREAALGPDHADAAESVSTLGELLQDAGDYPTARAAFERALAINERVFGNHERTATSLNLLGFVTFRMGDAVMGRQLVERSLAIRESLFGRDHIVASYSLINLGIILGGQADVNARPVLERALAIRERVNGPTHPLVATVLVALADVLRDVGDRASARAHLERALRIREAAGNEIGVATVLTGLGVVSAAEGDLAAARVSLDRSLEIFERLLGAEHVAVANSLYELGRVYLDEGRVLEARAMLERSLRIREKVYGREHPTVARTVRSLGDVLRTAGDLPGARQLYERALAISEARLGPEHVSTAQALHALGNVVLRLGDVPRAHVLLERALAIREKAFGPSHSLVAFTLRSISYLHRLEGNMAQARAYAERAVRSREQFVGPDHPGLSWELNALGQILRVSGDHAAARPILERALALGTKGGFGDVQWRAQFGLAVVDEKTGRLHDAVRWYRQSIRTLEQLASQFDEGGRAQFLQGENRLSVYDGLTRLLLRLHEQDPRQGHDLEALATLEAKRGRVVANALGASRPRVSDAGARRQAEDVEAQKARVRAIERALQEEQEKTAGSQSAQTIRELTARLAQTKAEYLNQVQAFLGRYPRYKTLFVDQQTVDPKMLAKLADRLPAGTLVVQYFSAPDALYVFVVAAGGKFQVKSQPVTQEELYDLVRQYRERLKAAEHDRLPWADDGSALYLREVAPLKDVTARLAAHLLSPIAQELAAFSNVVFIPNDLLLYLPLHALTRRVQGRDAFLAETHVVSYVTQLELLDLLAPATRQPDAPLLALANPDGSLPGASGEVRALRGVRSALTMLEGARATKPEFLRLASTFPQLHLATHGVLDPEQPERSYLLLAGADEASQRLSIAEIAGLSLQRALAILSACDTAVGEQVPGAALITLAAAFSQAGAEAIVASLWKVNDASTRDFMVAFHRELDRGQAVALHRAQQVVLREAATAHPYYWAAFILMGAR
jgi:CHAT domain-containing protein